MGKKVGECTPDELTAYNQAAELRELCILRAQAKLEERNVLLAPLDPERQRNENKIGDLDAELAAHRARVHAFNRGQDAINPPTDEQLRELKRLLDAIDVLTTQRRILRDVVDLTTDAAKTFREIQPALA